MFKHFIGCVSLKVVVPVKKNYLLSVASPFISRIDKDLEKLQEIKTDIPYMISVEEDN